MTAFEQYLVGKGFLRHRFDYKKGELERTDSDTFSTMMDLDYRWYHSSDINVLNKIANGEKYSFDWFTDSLYGEIIYGLGECGKPPTLQYPKPFIYATKIKDGEEVKYTMCSDDFMHKAFATYSFDEIFEAMFDRTIGLKISND